MSKKQIPTFTNEDEEREFWATHDSTKVFRAEKVEEELHLIRS